MSEPLLPRRTVLAMAGSSLVLPLSGCINRPDPARRPLQLGLIADLHHGLDPRAQERIEDFITAAQRRQVEMIVQLGDFNFADEINRPCMAAWNSFAGARYHVLGNHDMDRFGKEHVLDFWEMPRRYYSFDRGGYHFVVLDRNHVKDGARYIAYAKGNYFRARGARSHADPEQLEWLAADLAATDKPCVIFCHQGLGIVDGPHPANDGRAPIETVLRAANARSRAAGRGDQVLACFCGHEHLDRHRHRDGVHYIWVNSASYYWVGSKFGRMAPYADALYCFVEIREQQLILHGRRSQFVNPTPQQRGFPRWQEISAVQQDRHLDLS